MPKPGKVPSGSKIEQHLAGAYFFDAFETELANPDMTPMQIYLASMSQVPTWVNTLMALRNRIVSLVGLKNIGLMGEFDRTKAEDTYQVGDRVGIFSILEMDENEIVFGDFDRHLRARVSLCKHVENSISLVSVTTVVHVNNFLGRVYMFFVTPLHRVIVPATMKRIGSV